MLRGGAWQLGPRAPGEQRRPPARESFSFQEFSFRKVLNIERVHEGEVPFKIMPPTLITPFLSYGYGSFSPLEI